MPRNRVHKTPEGRYKYFSTDRSGKRRYLNSWKGEKHGDFLKRCDKLDEDCERTFSSDLTFDDLFQLWNEEHAKINLSPAEQRVTVKMYEKRIRPYHGRRKATELTQLDVYQTLNKAVKDGLGGSYIRKLRGCYSRPYNWANNTLAYQLPVPTSGLRFAIPTKSRKEASKAKDRAVPDHVLVRFFEVAKGTKYYNLFVLLLECGLRPSEGLGLQAKNINFKDNLIEIRQGMTADGESSLKNDTARRDVPMTTRAREVALDQIKISAFSTPEGWLFPAAAKEDPSMNAVRLFLTRIIKETGSVKLNVVQPPVKIRLYDFRHTFATRMVERGMDAKSLQMIMGHKKIETTLQYYAGFTEKMLERARQIMNE